MTTITTLAARITVLAIQGFMLDQRRSRDGPAVPRRLTAGAALRPPAPSARFPRAHEVGLPAFVLTARRVLPDPKSRLRQNGNRLDLDFVGRIGQLLDLY